MYAIQFTSDQNLLDEGNASELELSEKSIPQNPGDGGEPFVDSGQVGKVGRLQVRGDFDNHLRG